MIGHAKEWVNYAVEMSHGNHPKQCISETERELRFYRHDQWGFACLADEVHKRCLQRRGWPPFPAPLLSSKHCKQGDQSKYNAQSHDQGCNVMFMVAMC